MSQNRLRLDIASRGTLKSVLFHMKTAMYNDSMHLQSHEIIHLMLCEIGGKPAPRMRGQTKQTTTLDVE
jgi:hypothetical protein